MSQRDDSCCYNGCDGGCSMCVGKKTSKKVFPVVGQIRPLPACCLVDA